MKSTFLIFFLFLLSASHVSADTIQFLETSSSNAQVISPFSSDVFLPIFIFGKIGKFDPISVQKDLNETAKLLLKCRIKLHKWVPYMLSEGSLNDFSSIESTKAHLLASKIYKLGIPVFYGENIRPGEAQIAAVSMWEEMLEKIKNPSILSPYLLILDSSDSYYSGWTLAHELGHIIFHTLHGRVEDRGVMTSPILGPVLEINFQDTVNVMHPMPSLQPKEGVTFNNQQCSRGRVFLKNLEIVHREFEKFISRKPIKGVIPR
ncbi:MAG: hypothetical protein H6625_07500 [Bdellovibrionaceae bacterium]|nr:hypothetical protein [Pseudobdellovibrionaceae bacterium]